MKITFKILLTPLLVILPGLSYGQGYISSDYMPASTLKDDAGNKYGSGDLLILSGRYTLPFSVRHNEKGQQPSIVPMAFSTTKDRPKN